MDDSSVKKPAETSQIRSVAKALTIIDVLSTCKEGMPLVQIAKKMGIAKSTLHGLLSTLRDFGYVEQSPFTGNYKLGIRLFEIGNMVARSWDVRTVAKAHIHQLVNDVSETVHLAVLDKGDVLYIDKRECEQNLRIVSEVGMRLPAHCSGVGKALLAYLSRPELKRIIKEKGMKRYTKNTITDFETLEKELAKIRERGYAYDREEIMDNLLCVAVPIFNHQKEVCAAISISGPSFRMKEKLDELTEKVCQTAKEISRGLGYLE